VEHGYWEQKGLTSAQTDQGPYEFAVSGAGDEYIDLANTYLFVEAQIVADNDTALDAGADVGPVNLWMHSLFSDVSVTFQQRQGCFKETPKDTAKSMSCLISSPRKHRISFPGLVYVIIVTSFRIVMMSWFHSRENSFRFLQ
jgi:hypothetical protein